MNEFAELDRYLSYLCEALGHADRHLGLADYCRGLMLPIERKSVEPLAAHVDPLHVRSKHQSLHHFVADSAWSDDAVLARVSEWVVPTLGVESGCYWIDDTGHPKSGKHSVGVAHQYCGNLGTTANCQVAVSLSLATTRGSIPIRYRLYLPTEWADDQARRAKTGVPEGIAFATKPQIALAQIESALTAGVPPGVVLADAAYGDVTVWRDRLTALGLPYVVGIRPATTVWAPGTDPLPPVPWRGRGRPATRLRPVPGHQPVSVFELAKTLPDAAWQTVVWREGTNAPLSSRFACLRVRPGYLSARTGTVRAEEWLLIEWPERMPAPDRYWLSTAPAEATTEQLVFVAKMRWRIERDYRELKQEFGLSHYEGRNWRGFHHHATLCIAAYGFLTAQRLSSTGTQKNSAKPQAARLPSDFIPRGHPTGTTARPALDSLSALRHRTRHRASPPSSLSALRMS